MRYLFFLAVEDVVASARAEAGLAGGSATESSEKQGESLLLPYLVEHLRTSLLLEPRSLSSQSSEDGVPHVEDSGTESGEDLRHLQNRKQDPLGPGLLAEVQSALDKLQKSLSGAGVGDGKELDPAARETLLSLVARLQTSLTTPEAKPAGKNRFANRRLLRQNRHTVGVTREELADARRLLEETSLKDLAPPNPKPPENPPPKPYAVIKQSSAGDLMSPVKNFKPVSFTPGKVTNTVAKPYQNTDLAFVEQPVEVRIFEKPAVKTAVTHNAGISVQKAQAVSPPLKNIQYADGIGLSESVEQEVEMLRADSGSSLLEYDPSLRLFTPEQSVQIAVHQAAINKQLSREEEKPRKLSESDLESSEDELNEDDGDVSSDSGDETTVKQKQKGSPPREKPLEPALLTNFNKLTESVSFLKKEPSRFEKKLEEVQNEKKNGKARSIDELQRIHMERKAGAIESAQAKYQKNLANQAISSRIWQPPPPPPQPDLEDREDLEKSPSSASTDSSISHAQKLLQLAAGDKPMRFYGRSAKKMKMKRANTIDIPKPLNFYHVDDDTDYSDNESNNGGNNGLGAPPMPPILNPKTENDKRFLAFLGQHNPSNTGCTVWKKESESNIPAEHQWGNRFSRIKTAFEGQPEPPPRKDRSASIDARSFWKTADDTVAISPPKKSSHGPKLSRQGSIFLKKLFEQKAEEKPVPKPVWTQGEAQHEEVVVGSLTVCPQPKPPVVNKFSHAPLSAFRPVGKAVSFKSNSQSPLSPPLPWIKESPTHDKFLNSTLARFEGLSSREESPTIPPKSNLSRSPSYSSFIQSRTQTYTPVYPQVSSKQDPVSPPHYQPALKQNPISSQNHNPTSKQIPISPTSYNLNNSVKQTPAPQPNYNQAAKQNFVAQPTFTPKSNPGSQQSVSQPLKQNTTSQSNVNHTPKINTTAQTNYNHNTKSNSSNSNTSTVKQNSTTFTSQDSTQKHNAASQPIKQTTLTSSQPKVAQPASKILSSVTEPPPLSAPNLVQSSHPPVTTYSVDVAATTTVYPTIPFPSFQPTSDTLDSPQEQMAVTRVMGGAQQQQAVTVKQVKTREVEEGRSSAARSLSNMLLRFSVTPPPQDGSPDKMSLPQIKLTPETPGLKSHSTSPGFKAIQEPPIAPPRLSLRQHKTSSLDSAGDEVVTSRLQIPLYPPRSGSLQDLGASPSPRSSPQASPSPSPTQTLKKSESWHQLNGQTKPKRPQSLILPDLPVPQRTIPTALAKNKSAHSLSTRQVDPSKQKTVEKFLPIKKPPPAPALLDLDDNLENVDEAFEALFNSVAGGSRKTGRRNSEQLSKSSSTTALSGCK